MSLVAGQTLIALVRLPKQPTDCWIWQGPLSADGYPNKTFGGKQISGRRFIWQTLFGPLPDSLVLRMTCETRDCVNPYHMEVTALVDAQRAGANTILLPNDVADIRKARKHRGPGVAGALAARFGCSEQTIYDIWGRRSWRKTSYSPTAKKRGARELPGVTRDRLLRLLQDGPKSANDLCRALDLTMYALRYQIRSLISAGLAVHLVKQKKFVAAGVALKEAA
jgi:biotin operon repressor